MEKSAIKELKERLYANKTALMMVFQEKDKAGTGGSCSHYPKLLLP